LNDGGNNPSHPPNSSKFMSIYPSQVCISSPIMKKAWNLGGPSEAYVIDIMCPMCNNRVGKRGTLIGLSHSDVNLYNTQSWCKSMAWFEPQICNIRGFWSSKCSSAKH
jgi:hypothetical protein